MAAISPPKEQIATTSVEEGLDFACNLISSAIYSEAESSAEKAQQLLHELTSYIQLRYVGELLLALEYLSGLGRSCNQASFRSSQFWAQLKWVAVEMQLSTEELKTLELPNG